MELDIQYRISYENGQAYDRRNQLRIPVSKEEYKTVMPGVAKGIPLEGIGGIDEVLSRMKERVLEVDCYFKRDGTYCSK